MPSVATLTKPKGDAFNCFKRTKSLSHTRMLPSREPVTYKKLERSYMSKYFKDIQFYYFSKRNTKIQIQHQIFCFELQTKR